MSEWDMHFLKWNRSRDSISHFRIMCGEYELDQKEYHRGAYVQLTSRWKHVTCKKCLKWKERVDRLRENKGLKPYSFRERFEMATKEDFDRMLANNRGHNNHILTETGRTPRSCYRCRLLDMSEKV